MCVCVGGWVGVSVGVGVGVGVSVDEPMPWMILLDFTLLCVLILSLVKM